MHDSAERHAGAATRRGVRDILVIFVTAQGHHHPTTPPLVQAAMLKQSREVCTECVQRRYDGNRNNTTNGITDLERIVYCRLLHQSMALQANPEDGEAWQYLANTLIEYSDMVRINDGDNDNDGAHSLEALEYAILALEEAKTLIPCDARVYNTLGRALDRYAQRQPQPHHPQLSDAAQLAYKRCVDLLEHAQRMGCQVQEAELDAMRLNYGLHLANQDLFAESFQILEPLALKYNSNDQEQSRIYADAYSLCRMCFNRM